MGTLQTPNPTLYPTRSPIANSHPNPNQNQNPVSDSRTPSFDDISKFFSVPLFDAADSLGVCPSVLKKLCYENGLGRWPYRKFLSGKSIEEIKKDAAIEKSKQPTELPKVTLQKSDALSSSPISSSIVSQLQNKNVGAQHEMPKFRIEYSQSMLSSNLTKQNLDNVDEFKYGFPSNGLSTVTSRWWGNATDNLNGSDGEKTDNKDAKKSNQQLNDVLVQKDDNEDVKDSDQQPKDSAEKTENEEAKESNQQPKEDLAEKNDSEDANGSNQQTEEDLTQKTDNEDAKGSDQQPEDELARKGDEEDANGSNQQPREELADEAANLSPKDVEMSESKTNERDLDTQSTHLLSALRKKAAKEGKQALKLGVYRGHGVNKLDETKKTVLHQIFKSSLPSQWKDLSF